MLRIGLWWSPLTTLCWISTQWLWKVGVDSFTLSWKKLLAVYVSTYIFWANTTLSSKWLDNLTNSLISTHTNCLRLFILHMKQIYKNAKIAAVLTLPNHHSYSGQLVPISIKCIQLVCCQSKIPTCTSKPAFYFLHMHIFSYKWDETWTWYWKYILWGEGYFFDFLLELITACFRVAKQILEKLLKKDSQYVTLAIMGSRRTM